MNDLVHIGSSDIFIKEYRGQRVVTFKDIDLVHGRPEGTAGRNFRENKEKLIDGDDFFKVCPDEIRRNNIMDVSLKAHQDIVFLTESGYLMLVKSFTDDLAWKVQRQLVNGYFRTNQMMTIEDMMIAQLQEQKRIKQSVDVIDERVDNLENTMNIDYAQKKKLRNLAHEVGVHFLGGKEARAYRYKDENNKMISRCLFSRLWKDFTDYFNIDTYENLQRVKFEEGLQYINHWQPPTNMQLEIGKINRMEDLQI